MSLTNRTGPARERPVGLKPMLAISLALHVALVTLVPAIVPEPIPDRPKPKPSLSFVFDKKTPPKTEKPPLPKPPPPEQKPEQKPAEKKPEQKPAEKKPEEKPEAKDPLKELKALQRVKLGGAKDQPSNDQDKGSLPSIVEAEKPEIGKGSRPKEEAPVKAAKVPAKTETPPAEKPDPQKEPKPIEPPPEKIEKPEPQKPEPPKPEPLKIKPEPQKPEPPKKVEKAESQKPDPEKPVKPKPSLLAQMEKPIDKNTLSAARKILRDMRGRTINHPPPVEDLVRPRPMPPERQFSEAKRLLDSLKTNEMVRMNQELEKRREREMALNQKNLHRATNESPTTQGEDADPLAQVDGFIPLSQALQKLSRGGPVPKFMPDSITANVSSGGDIGMEEFKRQLLGHLQHYKVWPENLKAGIDGKVYISCEIDGYTGQLIKQRIWRSSGVSEIDRAGVATVKKCDPFPAIGSPGTLYLDLVLRYDENEAQRAGI